MPRSGGGFSRLFKRPKYQERAVEEFLYDFRQEFGNLHAGRYLYAPSRDLTFSYSLIYSAPLVVPTPTSRRKRSDVVSSLKMLTMSRQARPARLECVFPYSLLLHSPSSSLKYPADRQRLDSWGYSLTAQ